MSAPMAVDIPLPPLLETNPRLDQWVKFITPGKVTVATGRVEIGQGVLTAMRQIAADELDVSLDRIELQTGDTDLTPNEGYTAGSQSIQYGGVALRLACAEVKSLLLAAAATRVGAKPDELAVSDGAITRAGAPTGQDYWSLAPGVDLSRRATAGAMPKSARSEIGRNALRVDLSGKIFGAPAFVHDMALDGMLHARVVRQPRRSASVATIDEAAIRRAVKGDIDIVRDGNFLAILGADETVVDNAAAVAPGHVWWNGLDPINPGQEEARWLLQRPSIDRNLGPEPVGLASGQARYEASFTRMHIAHASIGPSSALALFRDGHLTVWSHTQGVYPLKAALARTLKLDPAHISVKHAQGPGCYGHNGADDAAADAAVIALRRPDVPIRVRWRREEEFGFEPVSPAMLTTVRAILDEQGRPTDWTTEIWSGRHSSRPGGGGNLLAAEALPDPPPAPPLPTRPSRMAAAARATASRFMRFRRSASSTIWSPRRRCARRRCAVLARPSMSSPSSRRWTSSPSAPAWTRSNTGLRYSPTRAPRRSSLMSQRWPIGNPGCRLAPAKAAASASRCTRTAPPIAPSSPMSRSMKSCASRKSGVPPMPVSSSTRMARSTSSRAGSFRASAGL